MADPKRGRQGGHPLKMGSEKLDFNCRDIQFVQFCTVFLYSRPTSDVLNTNVMLPATTITEWLKT